MNSRSILTLLGFLAVVAAALAIGWWSGRGKIAPPKDTKAPPATVVKEGDLNVVLLDDVAEDSLNVAFDTVQEETLPRKRTLGGEIVVPPGKSWSVTAPITGVLTSSLSLQPNQQVEAGDKLFTLTPIFSPEARATLADTLKATEGLVDTTLVQKNAAQVALARAQKAYDGQAGSKRAVDEAQADLDVASKSHESAQARKKLLENLLKSAAEGDVTPVEIPSPAAGIVRNIHTLSGAVPSGTPLVEIVDLTEVWIRVPVYVGDTAEIAAEKKVDIGRLDGRAEEATQTATKIPAPPSADPNAATVNLYYLLENENGDWKPGQKVGVTVTLQGETKHKTVPFESVVYDVLGGAWVYTVPSPKKYIRGRVEVLYVKDGKAVLKRGPDKGTKILVHGAAELYGTEFGIGK